MKIKASALLLSSMVMLSGVTSAAPDKNTGSESFAKAQKDQLINKLAQAINDKYVLADEGAKFSRQLLLNNQNGAYSDSTTKTEFIDQLNTSLYKITHDKHVSVRPQDPPTGQQRMMRRVVKGGPEQKVVKGGPQKRMVRRTPGEGGQSMKAQFGLPEGDSLKTSVLPGNIGLITVNDLMGTVQEVNDVMAKLNDTDGLIIDVRECPGGSGEISTQFSSYFMPEGGELMRYHNRGEPVRTTQSVELPATASRYLNKPVYLVTSGFTGSACEALSYILKYHNLATVLGEKTAGAGHAMTTDLTPVGFGLGAFIPNSRPEHPNHKGGFEKVGVAVDVDANAPLAVDRAQQMILTQLLAKNKNQPALTKALAQSTERTNTMLLEQVNNRQKYSGLLGDYGDTAALLFERGQLKYKSPNGRKYPLKQLDDDTFVIVSKRTSQKVRIDRDANGEITGISVSPHSEQGKWKVLARV